MSDDDQDRPGAPPDDAPPSPFGEGDEARHVPYEVALPGFSGPLELLLHLIRKHKLDILDIPVSFITQKYLEYIDLMKVMNLDVAAEYLEMAATLIRIKSRMLLPAGEDLDEAPAGEEPGDPRAELVKRLLEYQKYRNAADQLWERELLDRDVFAREIDARTVPREERPLDQLGIGALLDAFSQVLKRAEKHVAQLITTERVTVAQRIQELVDFMRDRRRVRFEQLFDGDATRLEMVVTFLALLEMTKLHLTCLAQAGPDTPLMVDFVGAVDDGAAVVESELTSDVVPSDPAAPADEPPPPVTEPAPAAEPSTSAESGVPAAEPSPPDEAATPAAPPGEETPADEEDSQA